MADVTGKHVLITGAAGGMGAEHARTLAAAGAKVVLTDVEADAGQKVAASIGSNALFVELDVSSASSWAAAVEAAERQFGPITSLVNNAGLGYLIPFDGLTEADFRKFIEVNQIGVFLGMKAVVPAMRRVGGGSITNISSAYGLRAGASALAYVATKFAVTGMTKAAAMDLGRDNIRVNSVHPGVIGATSMTKDIDDHLGALLTKTPLGRIGKLSEVSELVRFLVSDDGGYCTGAEFVIDGGLICHS
ncbi:SDR family oxidoreductase [Sphingobium sp. JS3065]|uniref:SDR family NAD(P)-dependent oxidoreductase n=1 Tax=Sphingobium sp. JS3065 TaxID=2970925 RepID=UPI0022645F2F|nr:SDR family oxidoreductase [Sphingobium sp. JS3065]UZW56376.1 SDR family oxidoreductase [Sphingobium sp. JS3065]